MAIQVTGLSRTFILKNRNEEIPIQDPNPDWPPERVMSYYEDTYPELVNSTVQNKGIENDQVVIWFKPTIGTKG